MTGADAFRRRAPLVAMSEQRSVVMARHRIRNRHEPDRRERDYDQPCQYMPNRIHPF